MSYWILFCVVILACLGVDLLFDRRRAPTRQEAEAWSLYWIGVAFVFGLTLCFRDDADGGGLEFLITHLIAKSLSLDQVIVIALIFAYYGWPLVTRPQ